MAPGEDAALSDRRSAGRRRKSADDALAAGIVTIYQELNLIPALSVAENIFLGDEPHIGTSPMIDWPAAHRLSGELLARGAESYSKNRKIWAFLVVGTIAILAAPLSIVPYFVVTLILGARTTRLPKRDWIVLPFAFAAHHATYFAGIVWGVIREKLR